MSSDWKTAIKINLQLLKNSPQDIETLNRLARAYLQTGQKTLCLKTYKKVLKIDKYNSIALKNLTLLKTLKLDRSANHKKTGNFTSMPVFLEEPGLTKTVSLIRLSDTKIVSRLHAGDQVLIVCREHNVNVISTSNQYLGKLPDDLASRLRIFIKAGNTYSAWIRSVDVSSIPSVRVFIRETFRSPKYLHTPSFPLTEKLTYAAFTPPELVHEEKPDVSATEYQEEDSRESDSGETTPIS